MQARQPHRLQGSTLRQVLAQDAREGRSRMSIDRHDALALEHRGTRATAGVAISTGAAASTSTRGSRAFALGCAAILRASGVLSCRARRC